MITAAQLAEASFWEETICVNCGATEGEAFYACVECDKHIVLPAAIVVSVIESLEVPEDE